VQGRAKASIKEESDDNNMHDDIQSDGHGGAAAAARPDRWEGEKGAHRGLEEGRVAAENIAEVAGGASSRPLGHARSSRRADAIVEDGDSRAVGRA
jgi:hypothetical protein